MAEDTGKCIPDVSTVDASVFNNNCYVAIDKTRQVI